MRRSWVVAGALVLVVVPSVPVAAAGVSLVLERVTGADGVGRWVRTGDVQRFRVRLNGMARGARIAVAASPVQALAEVACVPSSGRGPGSAGPEASGSAESPAAAGPSDLPFAGGHEVAGGHDPTDPQETADAGELTLRALSVVTTPATAQAAPGTRVCVLGRVSGERAVDVTLEAPEGAKEVVVAAVAQVLDVETGGLTTMSRAAVVQVGETLGKEAATLSGFAHRVRPGRGAESGPQRTRTGSTSRPMDGMPGVRPGAVSRDVEGVPGRAGAVPGGAVESVPSAGVTALPSASVAPEVLGGVTAVPSASVAPPPSSSAAPPGAVPQLVPQALPTAGAVVPGAPQAAGTFQSEAAGGEAPLPWGMAVAAKPVEPVRWVSPIDGPGALPMVVAAIGVLMGGLWGVVTVQRGRNRRKVM